MVKVRMLAGSGLCLAVLFAASSAAAQCSDWQREVMLPGLGCGPDLIDAICAGQLPMATQPYCDGRNLPPPDMGDWCQTTIGGCVLEQAAPLDSDCSCYSAGGWVPGWVDRQ